MNLTIKSAIEHRQLLLLQYHGYTRTVEPHAYGVNKDRVEKLRCYQVSGGSASFEPAGWKILNVSEIWTLTATETRFERERHGYKRGDKAMQQIYAQL